jgi:hypothetical protein
MAELTGLAALMAKRKSGEVAVAAKPESIPVVAAPPVESAPPKEVKHVTSASPKPNPMAGFFSKNAAKPQAQPTHKAPGPVPSDEGGLQLRAESEPEEEVRELGSVDSLADLAALTDEGIAPNTSKREAESEYLRSRMSEFDDETPATKPNRELPEGIESQQLLFVEMMDGVYDLLDDPDLLGAVIKNIMIELKSNPQYIQMVTKDDVRQWVRTMRHTMGLARIKKLDSKSSRGTTKAKPKGKAMDQDVLNAAAGIDWDNV